MASITTGTNIDVNTLVTQLMQLENQPLKLMQTQQKSYQTQITAYGKLQSAISALSTATTALQSTGTFAQSTATAGDTSILSASAASGTAAGIHSIEVQTLAQTQKLASGRFDSADSAVGTGTLSFTFGSTTAGVFAANPAKNSFTVTIDSSNNTLAGLRDAINKAAGGVAATIVNDGTGYRLALAPTESGKNNGLKITSVDDDGNALDAAGLSKFAFDPAGSAGAGKNLAENTIPVDAALLIDGIAVTSSSNTVSGALPGLTLNLTKTNVGAPTSLTVTQNTEAVKTALNAFVTAYNSFNTQVKSLTYYDAANKKGGDLQGDATARSMINQVRHTLTSPVSGLGGGLSGLSQVGVNLGTDGTLSLDSGKLEKALANPAFNVGALFATTGTATDSHVSFQSSLNSTPTGNYAIAITQPATRGSLTGNAAAALTVAAGVNDALSLTVNGQAVSVILSAGTYASADALAAEIQSKLNGSAALTQSGVSVNVGQSGGVLAINTSTFGASSSIAALGGSAAALFGGAPVASAGQDVAGTINGAAATGAGQTLISSDGLRLRINATGAGSLGSLSLTNGYGVQLGNLISGLLDTTGPLATRTTGLNASIKRNSAQQDSFTARMTTLEANYRRQFSALDAALSQMNTTSSFLTQQLASISSSS